MNGNAEPVEPDVRGHDGADYQPQDQGLAGLPDPASVMAEAMAWVEQNQTLAMLGAFALGVFIGTMMRD